MSAERQWMVCALAAVALSAAADADAQKQTPYASGPPGKGVPFVGFPGSAPPAHENGLGVGPAMRGMSGMKNTPGQGGALSASASGGGSGRHASGRDESDAPGESIQAGRQLREIPTCD